MKFNSKWFKKRWVSYTIATCSAVVLYMLLSHFSVILDGINSIFGFIKPVVVGCVIAYIFDPLSKLFETSIYKKLKSEKTRWKLSVATAIIVIIAAVVLLFVALIPQIVDSITTFVSNIGSYVESSQKLIEQFEKAHSNGILSSEFSGLANIVNKVLENIGGLFTDNMEGIVNSSVSAGKNVFDVVISFILAIYLLLDKRRIINGISRLMELILKEKTYKNSGEFFDKCNKILIRYISFDIIDGLIVGVVNAIYMLIAGLPYAVLISVIVGITNLAPTFGPIVGAVIGGFILVLVNPWYALWFLVFTIILQTVDGYILKPRLFGESLGVSPLMILISIILGGRLFGVVGILLAIPFAAIFDFIWKDFILKKLEERKAKRYNI
ncbi:MAG: AI-2E family transporter [Butyrivibrio sp.]|nr:AI-2E family transporter [Butyrivibrio sp.]